MRTTIPMAVAAAIIGFACATQADQPHMHSALRALTQAKAELAQADRDKGGHRARAEQLVAQALSEVRAGIEYDRRSLSPSERRP